MPIFTKKLNFWVPWNFFKMKTLTRVHRRALKFWNWTSKIIPDLWLLDLFCPIKTNFYTPPYCTRSPRWGAVCVCGRVGPPVRHLHHQRARPGAQPEVRGAGAQGQTLLPAVAHTQRQAGHLQGVPQGQRRRVSQGQGCHTNENEKLVVKNGQFKGSVQ